MPDGCLKVPKPLVICSLTHVLACIWYGLGCVSCVRDPLFLDNFTHCIVPCSLARRAHCLSSSDHATGNHSCC